MQTNRAYLTIAALTLAVGMLTGCGHATTNTAATTTSSTSSTLVPITPEPRTTSPGEAEDTRDRTLVTIDIHTPQVALHEGQRLKIDFGEINPSVGDSWTESTKPDENVLHDLGKDFISSCADTMMTGCGGHFVWRFQGVKPGTTTIEFTYCYRYGCGPDASVNSPDRPDKPVDITVTVQ